MKRREFGIRQMLLVLLVAVVLLGTAFWFRSLLTQKPTYVFESSSEVRFGQDGQTIIIDNGKKTVLVLDKEGKITRRYDGGAEDAAFFFAADAAQAKDGSVYVTDINYGSRGNLLNNERIIRLDGGRAEVVYEIDYTAWELEKTPLQYGRILELQAYGDSLYFLLDTVGSLEVNRLNADGTATVIGSVPAGEVKNSASYDAATNRVAVVNRSGSIVIYALDSGESRTLQAPAGLMPYDLSARNGEVYYTELQEKTVHHFSIDDPDGDAVFYSFEAIPFKLDVSMDGRDVLVTDQIAYYVLTGDADHVCQSAVYVESAKITYFILVILVWAVLVLGGLCAAVVLIKLLQIVFKAAAQSDNALRILLIMIASVTVTFVLGPSLLNQFLEQNTNASEKQVSLFTELLLSHVNRNKNALLELDSAEDYGSEAFSRLKVPLDEHTWNSYDSGDYFYYIIYRSIGGNVVMVMDFEDTMPCTRPMYTDDPEDNDYSRVLHTGDQVLISEISAYGAWTFQLTPIYGNDGSIIGELEVGQSLDSIQKHQNELRNSVILDAATSTVVIAMLLLELTFLLAFTQRKKEMPLLDLDNTDRVPVRTLMFLSYLADSMQDAFIAILCTRLYTGGLPIPDSVAVALPMSAQLLMMAVFSLFAGRMAEKYGSRRMLTGGMLVQLSGFLCCLLLGTYNGILIGKMLIGAGMGTVYVSCNTVASSTSNQEKAADAFAGVSAGTISGLTIGAGLSSVLLSLSGWRLIYLIGSIIVGLGVLLAFYSDNVSAARRTAEESEGKGMGLGRFMLNRRVIGFFLLILVPFMMALSYREYFFPLFASENGINEVSIGRIYLICGMIVIYVGPYLSAKLLKRFGALWSIVLASGLLGLDMLLFVLWPSLVSVIAGVVILSVVISFAYTCQYTYFERTPESSAYGEGRSMGIYSVFESLGQTVGPIAYGVLLTFGYQKGIGIFCAAMLILLLIFSALMRKSGKMYKRSEDEETPA